MLNIAQVIDLTTYEGNSPPAVVKQLTIIHEAEDGEIVQYFVDSGDLAGDKNSHAIGVYDSELEVYDYLEYDELQWGAEKRRITSRKIDYLHVKAFPGIGAYAAYKPAYQIISKIVIPVNNNRRKLYPYPTQVVTISGNNMHFVITDPDKVTYQCYRIVLRCNEYAEEYITYEREFDCTLPHMNGEYVAYIQGYILEGEEASELSPEYAFTVNMPGQSSRPPTTTTGNDIFVTGLSFMQNNRLRATLANGSHVDSVNSVYNELPAVGQADNGKVLGVTSGAWAKQDAPTVGIVFWRVSYYSTDGLTLLHKEYVEKGDDASWTYQDDKWSLTPGGTVDVNAKNNITANKKLYYVSSL